MGRREDVRTPSGIPVKPVFTPEDAAAVDAERDIGFPGEYPFTRGIHPTMYRGRLWTMRQYGGYAGAEESNRRYRYLLEQGQTGLSIAFDLPTQMGYDSDHPLAEAEVGKVGVAIDSLADMEVLFDVIPLDRVSTSMTINATAAILLCMYLAAAERRGVPADRCAGTTQNDILKEYIARGTYIYPPGPSLRLVADTCTYCAARLPRWNHTQTAGVALTAQQPRNNVVRVALQALAAVLGGTQSLHTNALDEALALPTDEAALLALRTQQIIAHESGAASTVDPLAGSYYVEHLTAEIERRAQAYLDQIERMGGMLRAIEQGYVQREIGEAAYREQQEIESGRRVVVGVNRFQQAAGQVPAILKVDPAVVSRQKARLAALRARRDGERVQ